MKCAPIFFSFAKRFAKCAEQQIISFRFWNICTPNGKKMQMCAVAAQHNGIALVWHKWNLDHFTQSLLSHTASSIKQRCTVHWIRATAAVRFRQHVYRSLTVSGKSAIWARTHTHMCTRRKPASGTLDSIELCVCVCVTWTVIDVSDGSARMQTAFNKGGIGWRTEGAGGWSGTWAKSFHLVWLLLLKLPCNVLYQSESNWMEIAGELCVYLYMR